VKTTYYAETLRNDICAKNEIGVEVKKEKESRAAILWKAAKCIPE
jgi:hypothetical protein